METSPLIQAAEPAAVAPLSLEPVLRHLSHELRQPLSGIEAIAYYLDMVLNDADPEITQNCVRLRRMVQQANWVLNDAALTVALLSAPSTPFCLATFFTALGARMAAHEEYTLDLHVAEPLPAACLPTPAPRFFEHLIAFLRDVGSALDPIYILAVPEDDSIRVTIQAETTADGADLLRIIGDPSPAGGVHAFIAACAGRFSASASDSQLTLSMLLPTVSQKV
ncbi:MAG: hypothetical protein HY821_00370 [Acidobacteria bacterium]|nr:hypothetical protein [Acidobacteriota bacterium]